MSHLAPFVAIAVLLLVLSGDATARVREVVGVAVVRVGKLGGFLRMLARSYLRVGFGQR